MTSESKLPKPLPSFAENWAAYILILVIAVPVLIYLLFVPTAPRRTIENWTSLNALSEVRPIFVKDDGDEESLKQAIAESLVYLDRRKPTELIQFGQESISIKTLKLSLLHFKAKLDEMGLTPEFSKYVQNHFRFFRSSSPKVLFTGYFIPQLHGSRTKSAIFSYPLYGKPDDLISVALSAFPSLSGIAGLPDSIQGRLTESNAVAPYYTRDQIDAEQSLAGRGLELVWVDDPVAAFFLHIQGSGEILLDDGTTVTLGYANKNGQPYRAIGKLLLDRGLLKKGSVTMQSIASYLRHHPEEQREIFRYNPSYVFFRFLEGGPVGNIEVPLTPYRSIATDYRLFPKGGLAIVKTKMPTFDRSGQLTGWKEHIRFALNQDTGGAIRGPGRVDLFTGAGPISELAAGHLNTKGELYFLLLK